LIHAARDLFLDQVFDETRTRQDRRAERTRERAHVGALAPVVFGRRQLQADGVVEHVRRWIGQHVQRAPQRGADRGVVGRRRLVVSHGFSPQICGGPLRRLCAGWVVKTPNSHRARFPFLSASSGCTENASSRSHLAQS